MVLKLMHSSKLKNTKYEQTDGCDICGLRRMLDYARATSAAAVAAAAALLLMLGVCDLCCTAVMRRLSLDATGERCAVCAWGVRCDVHVSPQSPKHDTFFRWPVASAAEKEQHTEHPRQHVLQ